MLLAFERTRSGRTRQHGKCLAMLLLPAILAASGQLPVRVYTAEDGLGGTRIRRIVRDSRGFLWFCTSHGLSRFDGAEFTTFQFQQTISNPSTNDLLETEEAVYWVATNGSGLIYFDATRGGVPHAAYAIAPEAAANRVNVLHRRRDGTIWLGTDGGLFRMIQDSTAIHFERVPLHLDKPDLLAAVFGLLEDREGSLWIGGDFGIVRRLPDGRMAHYPIRPGSGPDLVTDLLLDPGGRLWIAHQSGVVAHLPSPAASSSMPVSHDLLAPAVRPARLPAAPGEAAWWPVGPEASTANVSAIHRSADGRIWIGTRRAGLQEFDGSGFVRVSLPPAVEAGVVSHLAEDRDGNLWIATNGQGAARVSLHGFLGYGASDGVELPVCAVFSTRSGELVISHGNWRISRIEGGNFTTVIPRGLGPESGSNCASSQSIIQDHLGEWWIGARTGLHRYPAVERIEQLASTTPKAIYTERNGLPDTYLTHILEDSRGDLWISTSAPGHAVVTRWQRATDTLQQYTDADGLLTFHSPSALLEDHSGNLWISFREGGLARYRNNRFLWFGPERGVPPGSFGNCIADRSNRLWCAHLGLGVLRFDDTGGERLSPVTYSVKDGLSSDFVSHVGIDESGIIYAATARGLDRIDPAANQVRRYSIADGMPAVEVLDIFHKPGSGLWVGSMSGLYHLAGAPPAWPAPPPVLISGLRIGGVAYPLPEAGARQVTLPVIGPNQNSVEIAYLGISGAGSALRFRYQLEAGHGWSEATRDRSVVYPRLPSGEYRFSVVAIAPDGAASPQPATVAFRILPPVWRRWWFVTACLLIVMAPALAFARYRAQKLRQVRKSELALQRSREEHLSELERVRGRIATDLHDDVGSSLTQIAVLSEVAQQRIGNEDSELHEPLSKIAQTSRELVDSMGDVVWSINPHRDKLADLSQRMRRIAADMLTAREIAFDLRLPPADRDLKLDATVRREVFLIFKESLNNLVRHSGCTRAEVQLTVDGGKLRLTVLDNGKGFPAQAETDGHGLESMRRRAQAIEGSMEITSTPGHGVAVLLEVPLSQPAHYMNS